MLERVIEREARDRLTEAAFVGWQVVGAMGGKVGAFDDYKRKLGLADPEHERRLNEEGKRRSAEILERARKQFAERGAVRVNERL